jgi:hypothetical protein
MARHSAKDPTTLGCSSIAASCVGMVAMGSGACTGPCNGGANAGVDDDVSRNFYVFILFCTM